MGTSPDASSPQSIFEIRQAHLDLLKRWNDENTGARSTTDPDETNTSISFRTLAAAATGFQASVARLGRWIEDEDERAFAQSLIDYWSAAVASLPGRRIPGPVELKSFDPGLAEAAVEDAERLAWATGAADKGIDPLAQLLSVNTRGELQLKAPVPATSLVAGRAELALLIDGLITDGLLGVTEVGGERALFMRHRSVARRWERLMTAFADAEKRAKALSTVMATAELWKEGGARGVLFSGASIKRAEDLLGDEGDARAGIARDFIAASRRHQRSLGLLLGGAAATVAVLFWLIGDTSGRSIVTDKFERKIDEAQEVVPVELQAAVVAPAKAEPTAPQDLAGLRGWVWAGTVERPQLVGQNREPLSVDALQVGQVYRSRVSLYLRSGTPSERNRSAPAIGVLPADRYVTVVSQPYAQERPYGFQYWAEVRIHPRVYIQHAGLDATVLRGLGERLRARGFDVQPTERVPNYQGAVAVRYYFAPDSAAATTLAAAVDEELGQLGVGSPDLRCDPLPPRNEVQPTTLELWLPRQIPTRDDGRDGEDACESRRR